MAVVWDWKNKKGEFILKDIESKKTFKVELFKANCLGAMAYRYLDENKNKMYNFFGFFMNFNHFKDLIDKNYFGNDLRKLYKVRLNTYFETKEQLKMAEYLAKKRIKVELYYEAN